MKRILGSFNKRASSLSRSGQPVQTQTAPPGDFPEAIIVREMIAFCESGAPNSPTAGDEFLHLPTIVDAAESGPAAAREGANCIRKFLTKDYANRAYAQYNAVMLMRILTDNPGPTFTRNLDATFVKTVKDLLREGQDLSVQQILRETLDSFATGKADNETLRPLMEMWLKEKAKSNTKVYGNSISPPTPNGHAQPSQPGNHFARQHRQPRSLPPPDELAARIEEAKTTAKLLSQTVQSTPTVEIPSNDLIKEFADRASSASRSIQGYIHSTNPAPDEDTLLTLIETNDQLSIAMSKHQRALLQSRRAMSNSPTPPPPPPPQANNQENFLPPQGPPPAARGAVKTQQNPSHPPPQDRFYTTQHHSDPPPPQQSPPPPLTQHQQTAANTYDIPENPFADPTRPQQQQQQHGLFGGGPPRNPNPNQAAAGSSDPSSQPRS